MEITESDITIIILTLHLSLHLSIISSDEIILSERSLNGLNAALLMFCWASLTWLGEYEKLVSTEQRV